MTPEEKQQVKHKIEATIKQLEQDLPNLEEQAKPVAPDEAIGRLTRMDALNSQGIAENNLQKARHRLSRLKRMLTQIGDEAFGDCRDCGDPIPVGRLLAVPGEDLCVQCAAGSK